ncbi:MAG: class I SAM-dependent methyltransferase [Planctomycetota bacterium]|jgi:ubiquinone/menaquinone biosynthesis C-methylase UbiE
MVGHERYKKITAKQYDRKTLMYYLCRIPANRNLIPAIRRIENKKVLDVGLGTGSYTKLLLDRNTVVGIDRNPHLCELPITVHSGDATELSTLVEGEKFDVVLSTWMTDYLNAEQLQKFFAEAKAVLNDSGRLMVTFPNTYGFGFFYVRIARLIRKVEKYTHCKKKVTEMLSSRGFKNIEFINLNSWFFPWAYLVIAE